MIRLEWIHTDIIKSETAVMHIYVLNSINNSKILKKKTKTKQKTKIKLELVEGSNWIRKEQIRTNWHSLYSFHNPPPSPRNVPKRNWTSQTILISQHSSYRSPFKRTEWTNEADWSTIQDFFKTFPNLLRITIGFCRVHFQKTIS